MSKYKDWNKYQRLVELAITKYQRYFPKGERLEDLRQEGCCAILKALGDYDETRACPIAIYVNYRIKWCVLNYLRKTTRSYIEPMYNIADSGGSYNTVEQRRAVDALIDLEENLSKFDWEVFGDLAQRKTQAEIALQRNTTPRVISQVKTRLHSLKGLVYGS